MTVPDPFQPSTTPGRHPQPAVFPHDRAAQHVPYPVQPHHQIIQVVPAKSPGVAVLLTFLWLGAGHLYAGSTGAGIALMLLEFVLLPLAFLGVGIVLWVLIAPFAMFFAAQAAKAFNQRNGIIIR